MKINQSNTSLPNNNQVASKLNVFTNKLAKPTVPGSVISANMSNSNNQLIEGQTENHLKSSDELSNGTMSERRPKPIRAVGYGDIFSSGKPKLTPVDRTSPNDRLSTSLTCQLQKPIPKKPPPPAPAENNISLDHAPPPPPKPIGNAWNNPLNIMARNQGNVPREQARVIFEYNAANEDELSIKPGEIIDIISKKIQDQGWWMGELNGKIGMFPDNFVELVKPNNADEDSSSKSAHKSLQQTSSVYSVSDSLKDISKLGISKGFRKELESNLERSGNPPATFLSLKRNKPQQVSMPNKPKFENNSHINDSFTNDSRNDTVLTDGNKSAHQLITENNRSTDSSFENSSGKLSHITTNRAKGPVRRPPSNVVNKRSQSQQVNNEEIASKQIPDVPNLVNLPEMRKELASLRDQVSELSTLKNEVKDLKRYIKEMVGIFMDERQRVASIHVELQDNYEK